MNSELPDFVRELASFVPPADDWQRLDSIAGQVFARPVTQREIAALLGIFERYPAHDGYGVFWSILHGLESLPDYEPLLLASVRRVAEEDNARTPNSHVLAGRFVSQEMDYDIFFY